MLRIIIPDVELWDEGEQLFILKKGQNIQLEHSLVSISKWESKWNKAFLGKKEKTFDETIDYIKCMTITQNVRQEVYDNLTYKNIEEINKYITAPMTATYFAEDKSTMNNSETVTAELIYYWMIALNVPFECQKWHLNRLLALINVCNMKSQPQKKRSSKEIMARNAKLNEERRKRLNTSG